MSQSSFEFDAFDREQATATAPPAPVDPTYSVRELADAINGTLRRGFADGVWVRGEIQGWNERGPHAYFRIAEQLDSGKAVLNVQLFGNVRTRLRPLLAKSGLQLADGLTVRIFGQLDFFAGSGQLGLKMSDIDPRFTLGELALQRDAVLRRLVTNGLYDANRSRPLSLVPLRIGVVTSIDSAAWADFRHEIERSGFGFQLVVTDVRVQGDQAVATITKALRSFGRRADLDAVVLIRGGGARSELATFDDEAIATAIGQSPLPVFTGLGHETDHSVADEVAHLALKTPTACAAALVERVAEFSGATEDRWEAIERAANRAVLDATAGLDVRATRIAMRSRAAVDRSSDRLDQRTRGVQVAAARLVERSTVRVDAAAAAVRRVPQRIDPEVRHLDELATRLRLLDPANTMARGWSITRTAAGVAVVDASSLSPGTELVTTFARGTARSRVEETST